jgi:hypothetical protein
MSSSIYQELMDEEKQIFWNSYHHHGRIFPRMKNAGKVERRCSQHQLAITNIYTNLDPIKRLSETTPAHN